MNNQSQTFMSVGFGLSFLFALTLIGEGIIKMRKSEGGAIIFILGVLCVSIISVFFLYLFFSRAQ